MGKLRPFKAGDWSAIKNPAEPMKPCEADEDSLEKYGVSATYIEDDVPLGCGGVFEHDGVAECWLKLSQDVIHTWNSMKIIEILKDMFEILKGKFDVPIICRVLMGFQKGEKLVLYLGFTFKESKDDYKVYQL